jgi:YjbE family integral membrane protein
MSYDLGLSDPMFWTYLLQVIGVDLILSGDNAVVIALACRSLPKHQQRIGVILGGGAAVALRIIFAAFVTFLMEVPYLKLVGGILLFWVGYKLILPEEKSEDVQAAGNLWGAVRTILLADAVMSLDNVLAVAAAAHGSVVLLAIGLLISIPLVIGGATLLLRLNCCCAS